MLERETRKSRFAKINSAATADHRFSPRSILVGMVHGLAGSAALMLLVVPTIPSPAVALLYILVFGIGAE